MLPSSIYDHLHFPLSPWRFKSIHCHSVQYFNACSLFSIFFLLLWIWLKQQIVRMLILTTITADHQYNTEIPSLVQNIVTANLKIYKNHQVHGHEVFTYYITVYLIKYSHSSLLYRQIQNSHLYYSKWFSQGNVRSPVHRQNNMQYICQPQCHAVLICISLTAKWCSLQFISIQLMTSSKVGLTMGQCGFKLG